jgi:SAM-dependent methyltransferase
MDLERDSALRMVDPMGVLDRIEGRDVLCLASGGGQQSAAFGILGARVTVLDLSEVQLQRDQEAARHYGLEVRTVQGDMRDLSAFADGTFDIVYHPYSLNFVPDARPVFREVARVLRIDGFYRVHCANPFTHAVDQDGWDGKAYLLRDAYVDGAEIVYDDPYWEFEDDQGASRRIRGPREFRHTLSTLLNGLIEHGFVLLGAWEETTSQRDPEPGTWEHFKLVAAPWLTFCASYRPYVFSAGLAPHPK